MDELTSPNRYTKRRVATGAALLLGLGAAFAVVDPNGSASSAPNAITLDQVAEIRAGLDKELETATSSQRAALSDGTVSPVEIAQLAQEASDCSTRKGLPPIEVKMDRSGNGFQWSVATGDLEVVEKIDECWFEYVGVAEQYFGLQALHSVEAQLEFNSSVVDCLREAGTEADGWPRTRADIDPSLEARCVDAAERGATK